MTTTAIAVVIIDRPKGEINDIEFSTDEVHSQLFDKGKGLCHQKDPKLSIKDS